MASTVLQFLLFFGAGVSILMALRQLMFSRKSSGYIMATFMILQSVEVSSAALFFTPYRNQFAFLLGVPLPFAYLIGPLLYLFFNQLLQDHYQCPGSFWLHVVPAPIVALMLVPFYRKPIGYKVGLLETYIIPDFAPDLRFYVAVLLLHISAYIVAVIVQNYRTIVRGFFRNVFQRFLCTLLGVGLLIIAVAAASISTGSVTTYLFFLLLASLSSLILFFSSIHHVGLRDMGAFDRGMGSGQGSQSYSYLDKLDLPKVKSELEHLLVDKKIFYDPDLSLSRLAEALGLLPPQLSQLLNHEYKQNFNSMVNVYRIEESKVLMQEKSFLSNLAISNMIGFNSYTSFYSAFKKHVGVTPKLFRRTLQDA